MRAQVFDLAARRRLAWHYTIGDRAAQIAESGFIQPAICLVAPNESPAVWFSRNQFWEPTACKGIIDPQTGLRVTATPAQMSIIGNGLYRFGVDPASLLSWPDLIRATHMRSYTAAKLERAGRDVGACPSDWLGSMAPVTLGRVLRIEQRSGARWVTADRFDDAVSA